MTTNVRSRRTAPEVEVFNNRNGDGLLINKEVMERLADKAFRRFNGTDSTSKVWFPYQWNMSVQESRKEFTKLVAAVLASSEGRVVTATVKGEPAGFSIVTGMSIFTESIRAMKEGKLEKVEDYTDVVRQLKTYEKIADKFNTLLINFGYFADIAVAKKLEGKGVGKVLVRTSIEEVTGLGKDAAMAWTVNPVMGHLLKTFGAVKVPGIGRTGRGIDFAVQESTGLIVPTVSAPEEGFGKVNAKHYVLTELQRAK